MCCLKTVSLDNPNPLGEVTFFDFQLTLIVYVSVLKIVLIPWVLKMGDVMGTLLLYFFCTCPVNEKEPYYSGLVKFLKDMYIPYLI